MLDTGGEPGRDLPFAVELRDARGEVIHRAELEPYSTGSDANICGYTPRFGAAYRDVATRTLYVYLQYHFRDDCDVPTEPPVEVWSEDPAQASPEQAIAAIVERQFDVLGSHPADRARLAVAWAPVVTAGAVAAIVNIPTFRIPHTRDFALADFHDVDVAMSGDGTSAWASATAILHGPDDGDEALVRASDVLVRTKDGWRLAAMAWTVPVPDAEAERDARAGKRKVATLNGDTGSDASLRDAFAKLTTDGVDAVAAARKDLVVIGSAPGERTVGGKSFAAGWNQAWKGKLAIASSVAHVLPSTTTGWVAATGELASPRGAKIPVTIFAVFDKGRDGQWSLVHVHFAV